MVQWNSSGRMLEDPRSRLTELGPNENGILRSFKRAKKGAGTVFRKARTSLIDRAAPHLTAVSRFGISKIASFWNDPFHTLLNLEWVPFIGVFFTTYMLLYLAFAWVYWIQGGCVVDTDTFRFSHAIWLSSRVASTLGFDAMHPDADCPFINFCVMVEVIASSLVNFIMLGVVFARFSAPFKRASTVRFSKVAVVHRHPSGFWAISLRVANLRKHQILQPAIRLVATAVDSITPSFYHHEQLLIDGLTKQLTNLELGFPAHITHVITPDSHLYNYSLLEMDTRMMELLVFVDGIDAMTSRHMSARMAYSTSDIYMNEIFAPMNLEQRGRSVGLDFRDFDKTVPAIDPSLLCEGNNDTSSYQVAGEGNLWQLRHQTFKKLAEKYAHLSVHVGSLGSDAGSNILQSSNGPAAVPPADAVVSGGNGEVTPKATQALLPPDAVPSHTGLAVAPAVKHVSISTSGMPFAVSRPAAQSDEARGLAALFGANKAVSAGTGGAWLHPHSQAHQNAEGSGGGAPAVVENANGESFVPLTAFNRSPSVTGGTAWQHASPQLLPRPVSPTADNELGRPAAANFTEGNKKDPLLDQGLYSLEDDTTSHSPAAQHVRQESRGSAFPSPEVLPNSLNSK